MSTLHSVWLSGRNHLASAMARSLDDEWRLDAEERERRDQRRLHRLLMAAQDLAPYKRHLQIDKRTSLSECRQQLLALPLLRKDQVRGREREFWTTRWAIPAHTSGTTGTPVALRRSPAGILREQAWVNHTRGWAGYRPGAPTAILRGDLLPQRESNGVPYHYSAARNMLVLSSYHLNESNIAMYVRLLDEHRIKWVAAYPSSVVSLAVLAEKTGADLPELAGVFTSSETLTPTMRSKVEGAFSTTVWDHYGNAERTVAASQCEARRYHFLAGYSLIEELSSGIGSTSLIDSAMPLLRYVVTDNFDGWQEGTCDCGRLGRTVERVIGRLEDIVFGAEGRRIGRLDHLFKSLPHALAGQIEQSSDWSVTIRVVPAPEADRDILRAELLRRARDRIGSIPMKVEMTESLVLNSSGKAPFVIQRGRSERR